VRASTRVSHYKSTMLAIWNRITTEFYGRRICAAYVIEDGTLKVKAQRGEKGARFGGSNSSELAERLLCVGGPGKSLAT
jgi:hypothetical protein